MSCLKFNENINMMKNMNFLKVININGSLTIFLLSISSITTVYAAPTPYSLAKNNFETQCVRGLATPVLVQNKVFNHSFKIKNSTGDFPILYGEEKASLPNHQNIQLENSGCEFYTFQIKLTLNADMLEKNQKLCQSCLAQQLKSLALYLKKDDQDFYFDGIKALEQQLKKKQTFKIHQPYVLAGSEDMPQTIEFSQIKKQANGQYTVDFYISTGPL